MDCNNGDELWFKGHLSVDAYCVMPLLAQFTTYMPLSQSVIPQNNRFARVDCDHQPFMPLSPCAANPLSPSNPCAARTGMRGWWAGLDKKIGAFMTSTLVLSRLHRCLRFESYGVSPIKKNWERWFPKGVYHIIKNTKPMYAL